MYGDQDNLRPTFDADDNTKRRGRPRKTKAKGPCAAEVEEIFPPEALEPETQEPAPLPASVRDATFVELPPALPPALASDAPAPVPPVQAVPELPVSLEPPPPPVRPSTKYEGYNANVAQGRNKYMPPRTLKEAIEGRNNKGQLKAMRKDLNAFVKNAAWKLVQSLI
jgi:hypothetical protein